MAPLKVVDENIQQKKYRDIKRQVNRDFTRIQESIMQNDKSELIELHRELDGRYGAYIQNWGIGMYCYNSEYGFDYVLMDAPSLIDNLKLMKAKIEGAMLFQDNSVKMDRSPNVVTTINNNNTINNQVNINVAIDEAKEKVEELTALPKEQIDEINSKLDELRLIIDSKDKKTTKWEKAKPIIKYIIDKGLDVAKIVLPIIQNI